MDDLISRQAAIDAIMGQPPEPHYPSWYAAQIEKLPAAQPATSCSEIPNGSDDTISRQAAIDAITDELMPSTPLSAVIRAKNRLKELPSVQPDHTADSGKKVCVDTISRQAAIDALDKRFDDVPMELTTEILQLRRDLRERIPSAQPATNCSEIPNGSDDTISRRAAIDALDEQIEQCNKALGSFDISPKDEYAIKVERASLEAYKEQLENMPSAQPEIIRCEDCDWWTKQEDSVQGRCELMQMYPAGGWYCGNARRRGGDSR